MTTTSFRSSNSFLTDEQKEFITSRPFASSADLADFLCTSGRLIAEYRVSIAPEPATKFMTLRHSSGIPIQGTALCLNHYNNGGRRNYSEQIAEDGEDYGVLTWSECTGTDPHICFEADERSHECGDS